MSVEEITVKVAMLEEGQRNVIRSLAKGDSRFEQLYSMVGEIRDNTIKLIHTVNGNGQPGLCQKMEIHTTKIEDIEKRCAKREGLKDAILEVKEELTAKIEAVEPVLKTHDEFFTQAKGILNLFRFIGWGGLAGIILFFASMVVEFMKTLGH